MLIKKGKFNLRIASDRKTIYLESKRNVYHNRKVRVRSSTTFSYKNIIVYIFNIVLLFIVKSYFERPKKGKVNKKS